MSKKKKQEYIDDGHTIFSMDVDADWNNQKDKKEHYWYYSSIGDCLADLDTHQAYKEYCELVAKTFN